MDLESAINVYTKAILASKNVTNTVNLFLYNSIYSLNVYIHNSVLCSFLNPINKSAVCIDK